MRIRNHEFIEFADPGRRPRLAKVRAATVMPGGGAATVRTILELIRRVVRAARMPQVGSALDGRSGRRPGATPAAASGAACQPIAPVPIDLGDAAPVSDCVAHPVSAMDRTAVASMLRARGREEEFDLTITEMERTSWLDALTTLHGHRGVQGFLGALTELRRARTCP